MAESRTSEPKSLILAKNMEVNVSEMLDQIFTESEDNTTALLLQITLLKEYCQKLIEERDAAKIDYAVAEGKLLARDCESHCRDCCLKDKKISHLEEQLEAAKLENAEFRGHNTDLKGQLDNTKKRLHQYERKKRKRKPSQLLQHHDYQNGPIISPTTDSESVPARSPFHPATCRATEDSACDRLFALKDVLYTDDQLVKELAASFEPTCIQGHAQSGSWIELCYHLNICPANLYHIDPKSRLLDILKEYQKTSENDISVKELRKIFEDIGNRNSACRLFRVAQLHMIPSNQAAPHKVEDLNNEDYDVSDSDLDSSSSEDWVVV